jgi:hypothetical protein
MAETKTVNLEVNSNLAQTEQAVTSLRSELRKAQAEVAAMSDKFGATSKEAIEAAKRAADLKDRIGDAKGLTDSFNPDAKFKALTSSLSGAAGGLSAVTGAMGLLGTQSEDVEAAILKVQSAMAISQGIQAVGESIDSFKQLGAVIKDAGIFQKANTAITAVAASVQKLFTGAVDTTATSFKGLKAAIVSTGIGALVVGLGYLISKMMESSDATEELTDKQKRLNDELEYTKKLTDDTAKSIDYYTNIALANAKKRGASEKELLKIQLDALEEKGKANIKEVEDIQKKQDKEYGLTKEQNKRIQELREQNLDLQRQGNLLLANADAELEQKNKENRKKTKEERNKELEENKKEEKRKREEAEKERAEFQNAKGRAAEAEYDAILKIEEEAREKNRLAGLTEIEQVNDKYNKLIQTAKDAGVSTIELEIEQANAINDINLNAQNKLYADLQEAGEREIALDLAIREAKRNALDTGLNILSQFAGKNKTIALGILAIQKGLAIADIVVGASKSIAAAQSALAATPAVIGVVPNPMYAVQAAATVKGIALTKITAATSIASILAASIGQAKSITGGDGGGGSAPSGGGGGGGSAAPQFNVVGNSGVNQLAQTLGGNSEQAPIQAYVVANDVTTAQGLNRNIVTNASLG